MTLRKLYLPIGILLAITVAFAQLQLGFSLKAKSLISWFVAIIFFIYGFETSINKVSYNKSFLKAFIYLIIINLILGPFIGIGVSSLLNMSPSLVLGLIVISSAPPTLSSGVVITEIAGGDTRWALMFTIGLNLFGIITIPFMVKWCLKVEGTVDISTQAIFIKLVLMVLIPFLLGLLLKQVLKRRDLPRWTGYVPSTCVILTVWIAFSDMGKSLLSMNALTLIVVAAGVIIVHFLFIIIIYLLSTFSGYQTPQKKAMVFVGSQKTLPLSISVLVSLNNGFGDALLVCIGYHFLQLLADSIIAPKWSNSIEI